MNSDVAIVAGTAVLLGLGAHVILSRRASSSTSSSTAAPATDTRGPAALGYGYDTSAPETDPGVLGHAGASLTDQYLAAGLYAQAEGTSGTS